MKHRLLVRRSLGEGGILFILLSLAALAALIWLIFPAGQPEPVYQGKPLRHWLALYTLGSGFGSSPADDAVRQIGTNAIPTLLQMLQEHDSPLKRKWIALLQKQHFIKPPQPAWQRNYQAGWAFHALGPAASNAVPALVQIYGRKISFSSQDYTLGALIGFGPAAFPAANPVFLDALNNTNIPMRREAALAIGQIHGQPDTFVPVLINALKDSDRFVQKCAFLALAANGPAAKSAVPALISLLKDRDPTVQFMAADALKKIDPIAAANAGTK